MAPLGAIIVLGIAFTLSGGAAVVVMSQTDQPEQPVAAGFLVSNRPEALEVRMTDGQALPVGDASLVLVTGPGETQVGLEVFRPDLGPKWDAGESVCLVGQGPACWRIDPAPRLTGFRIVSGEQVLYTWDGTPKAAPATGSGGGGSVALVGSGDDDGSSGSGGSGGSGGPDGDTGSDDPVTPPDLEATVLGSTPSSPAEGDQTRFRVRVDNTGDGAAGPFELTVGVDGSTVSTTALSSLAAGGSVTVRSDAWTAEGGSHTVTARADAEGQVEESDEANNHDAMALAVGERDPGHAYEDVDNDVLFTPGTDIPIPDEQIHAGEYHVQDPWSLVVPASVGDVTAERINLTAGDEGHVVLGVDLTTTDERVHVRAGTFINATGTTISSPDERIDLDAAEGPILVNGTTLDSSDERVILRTDGPVHGASATMTSASERVIVDAGGPVNLSDATLEANERIPITAGSDVDLQHAILSATEELTVDATAESTVLVDGASFSDEDDTLVVSPDEATIEGTPSQGEASHGGADGGGPPGGGP